MRLEHETVTDMPFTWRYCINYSNVELIFVKKIITEKWMKNTSLENEIEIYPVTRKLAMLSQDQPIRLIKYKFLT